MNKKGFIVGNKFVNLKGLKAITIHNDNELNSKEHIKEALKAELKNLSTNEDTIVRLAKIASLTSLYLDIDSKGADVNDRLNILINNKTGLISITSDDPDDNWTEALAWDGPKKANKSN